ncbi:MAG: DUF4388 domain-containing protein [Myxococcales bacterium]|nr:DUF4388 domain-containing protein [Myxococcales bacterium]MCB9520612.1 DUF4388 domain-containing protein [Myxococcales bacterium]MCB9531535.1 DUF4388 domain-containing protein [Myxococcales bacterium]
MATLLVIERDPSARSALVAAVTAASPGSTVISADADDAALAVIRTTPVDVAILGAEHGGGLDALAVVLALAAGQRAAGAVLYLGGRAPEGELRSGLAWVSRGDGPNAVGVAVAATLAADRAVCGLAALTPVRLLRAANALRWSGALAFRVGRNSGVVVVRAGELIHASFGEVEGELALEQIATATQGTIVECDPPEGAVRTIYADTRARLDALDVLALTGEPDVEISEEDLVQFLDEPATSPAGFRLFDDEELAAFALDDAMAQPLRGSVKR